MALTATVLSIEKRDEAFSLNVRFNDANGREVATRTMSFQAGVPRASVEAEIQKVGNILEAVADSVFDVETLKGTPIIIVRQSTPSPALR